MNIELFPLKELILLFRNELSQRVLWEQGITPISSTQDPLQSWEKTEAYSWIFFETNYLFFWGASDKFYRQYHSDSYPDCLLQDAGRIYSKWGMQERIVSGCPSITARTKEIYKYKKYGIPEPLPNKSLIEYIKDLRNLVSEKTYSRKMWRESLASFLEYVRTSIPQECQGHIDIIFPEDRAFYSKTIIRLIRKEKFPTNIIFASQMLKNLSEAILQGDKRTQYTAVEALAFSWLCLASARLQHPTTIKLLLTFNFTSLAKENCPERIAFPHRYVIKVPTLFGDIPAEISEGHFNYLSLIAKNQQTFKSSQRSLERLLDRAVNQLPLKPKDGEITFTTLTSWPNEVMHHRCQIDNSKYKNTKSLS
jgi:hypothetical protein